MYKRLIIKLMHGVVDKYPAIKRNAYFTSSKQRGINERFAYRNNSLIIKSI